jgi:O-acetyl-ADP-ribose deacetylase (regulator of RNase III)
MACHHVIHTVGPIWQGGARGEPEVLGRCYRSCLALAAAHGLTSIAFPSLSTGAYGYPVERAAAVALSSVREALAPGDSSVRLVRFVLFSRGDLETYERTWERL